MSLGSIQNIAGELFPKGINWVWNPVSLQFEVMIQPAGGVGGSGPVSITDGADIAQGTRADPAWDGAAVSATVIAIAKYTGLKIEAVRALLSAGFDVSDRAGRLVGHVTVDNFPATSDVSDRAARLVGHVSVDNLPATQPVSVVDAADVAQGARVDAAWDGAAANATLVALAKYTGLKVEAVRALLAATLQVDVTDEVGRVLGHVQVDNLPATQAVSEADGTNVAFGARADAAWDGVAAAATLIQIVKYLGIKEEAVRALLAGTINVALADNIARLLGQVDVTDEDARILGRAKLLNTGGVPIDPATEGTLSLLARDATVAKDATVAQLDTDFKAATGLAETRPAAYTELDRLYQLGVKIDNHAKVGATEATMQKMLAAVSKPVAVTTRATLLHR